MSARPDGDQADDFLAAHPVAQRMQALALARRSGDVPLELFAAQLEPEPAGRRV
jgi:hypothetical protein